MLYSNPNSWEHLAFKEVNIIWMWIIFQANAANHVHYWIIWPLKNFLLLKSFPITVSTVKKWSIASLNRGWLGFILSPPCLYVSLATIIWWKGQITKYNHIKFLREFCGLKYLNSPKLLYNQLTIFFKWLGLDVFQGVFLPCSCQILELSC